MPLSLRILLRFLLTIVLIWAMKTYLGTWFVVTGGWPAYIIIAALITLMNIFVLPVLNLLAAPLKFLMTAVAVLLVNGIFLWLTVRIVSWMEPTLVTLKISGGIPGWFIVLITLGIAKSLMNHILR